MTEIRARKMKMLILGLLFSAEADEVGLMLVVMGLESSKYVDLAEAEELVDEEYEDDEGKG